MNTAKVLFPNDEEIYKIIKGLPNAEKLQDKIWESFCLDNETVQSKNKSPKQRRFKKHPDNFKNENEQDEKVDYDLENKEDEFRINKKEDYDSDDSDYMTQALFGTETAKGKTKCQSAKCRGDFLKGNDEYDSLEEFCDVTFRNIRSVTNSPYTIPESVRNKCPRATNKKVVPSVVVSSAKPPAKMMSPIKPLKKPFTMGGNVRSDKVPQIEMVTTPIQYDMNKDRSLKAVLQKCNNVMDDIRLLIDIGIPQPDGEEDYIRRKKRAVEFSNRFSRIYLYELNRQINDIRKLLRPHTTQRVLNTAPTASTTGNMAITQKFVQALQLVRQSLLAYHNHLPTSIMVGAPDKLKDLLGLCATMCQLQAVLVSREVTAAGDAAANADNIFTSFSKRSESLLERINECSQIDSATSLLKSDRSKLSLLGYNVAKNKGNSKMQLNVRNSRFSMYGERGNSGGCRKDAYWRNTIASLGKKHFNVSSRYKTAKFKHRPPVERVQYLTNQQNQPSFQAFPINLRPAATNNQKDTTTSKSNINNTSTNPTTNLRQAGTILIDQNLSEMSIGHQNTERGTIKRRGRRPRYSLNDDDINTVMQNVAEDNNQFATDGSGNNVKGVAAGRGKLSTEDDSHSQSSGEADVRLLENHHQINCNHPHKHKTPPQTPTSSPQQTSQFNLTTNLIGDSSQCDLAPPSLTITKPRPPIESNSSIRNCHCCRSDNKEQFDTNTPVENCCSRRVSSHRDFELELCLECKECRKQLQETDLKQRKAKVTTKTKGDDRWNRLSTDCDRTMKRLDERTVRRGNNKPSARRKCMLAQEEDALNSLAENDEDLFRTAEDVSVGDKNAVKLKLAKCLAGLVAKKSAKKEEQDGDGDKKSSGRKDNRKDKITVTSVTGVKNAKLICIRDDNSLVLDTTTSDIVEEPHKAENKPNTCSNHLKFVHSQTQTEVPKSKQLDNNNTRQVNQLNGNSGQKRKNVKISRLPKAKVRRQLQMLDKEMSLNVIRYKLEYHKARKENPMYKKAANGVQPWALMEKVSDGILDHLLLSVAREIQVDDILVKLYESEFYAA